LNDQVNDRVEAGEKVRREDERGLAFKGEKKS